MASYGNYPGHARAFAGAVFGFLLSLFAVDDTAALELLLVGLALGAVAGGLWFCVSLGHGGRSDFSAVSGPVAGRYDVIADDEVADEAARCLASWRRSQARWPGSRVEFGIERPNRPAG